MTQKYDAIIIGAGMSGLGCGIRLAMYKEKVLILEKHTISGGLNSYYQRRNETLGGFRQFDSGLHALTNFVKKGTRGKPLTKMLKQLRIPYDALKLREQTFSTIKFRGMEIHFTNSFNDLREEVKNKFTNSYEEFMGLVGHINNYNELDLSNSEYRSARGVLSDFITDDLLKEMLLAPLLIYGSAWEDDMDFNQFVIMFKSIYQEGFSRPEGGVRTLLRLLLSRFKEEGGELRFRAGVEKILVENGKAIGVELKKGEIIYADKIYSSMGYPETVNVLSDSSMYEEAKPAVGPLTFMESIMFFDKKIPLEVNAATIIFYNDTKIYDYRKPVDLYDDRSAVICFPDNYEPEDREGEGCVRVTFMANYDEWKKLERKEYRAQKVEALKRSHQIFRQVVPNFDGQLRGFDVFTPTTIKRYTFREDGIVYGSTDKTKDGTTKVENLIIIGTDQGFLGVIGSILSGISMANLHGLMEN